MEENELPIRIRGFAEFDGETALVVLQILSETFKGFKNPAKILGNKTSYEFGDSVGIVLEKSEADKLQDCWVKENEPLGFFSEETHSFRLV